MKLRFTVLKIASMIAITMFILSWFSTGNPQENPKELIEKLKKPIVHKQPETVPTKRRIERRVIGIEEITLTSENLLSPQSEVEAAYSFAREVQQTDPKTARYLRFFTTYNIKIQDQEEMYYELCFWIHSLLAPGYSNVVAPQRVPNSNTLYYVEYPDYGWKLESWEELNKTDPYFKEPWVHFEDLNNLRLATIGNSIVRADWFIYHTSDTTVQEDRDVKTILYYTMIYGKNIPNTLKEFQTAWGVDMAKARRNKINYAAIVKNNNKIVALHNRQLERVRIGTGYYWETFDVKNENGVRDYIENLFPTDNARDASEAIVTNNVGMQVYFLVAFENGVSKRVQFGDPTVVRSLRDPHGDVRVRTARSCVTCHGVGIIGFEPRLKTLTEEGKFNIELAARTKEIQIEIERFYFSPISEFVGDDQLFFARAMKRVNGQKPVENTVMFNTVMTRYAAELDLETAARECGVTPEVFTQRMGIGISGRLLGLINGGTIPRAVWENPIINGATFGHAMLLVSGIQKKDTITEPERIEVQPEVDEKYGLVEVKADWSIYPGSKIDKDWIAKQSYAKNNQGVSYVKTVGIREAQIDLEYKLKTEDGVWRKIRFIHNTKPRYREIWFLIREAGLIRR